MAMITCPECGKKISDAAEACPSCGKPFAKVLQGVKDPYCRHCQGKGIKTALVRSTAKKVPGGANFIAVLFLLAGIGVIWLYGIGAVGILIAILIWSLGKKDYPALRCPTCNAVRFLEK